MSGELQMRSSVTSSISTALILATWGRWRFGLRSSSRRSLLMPAHDSCTSPTGTSHVGRSGAVSQRCDKALKGRLESPGGFRLLQPMIRSELVTRIAELNPHLYEKDCEAIVRAIFDRITEALAAGDRVEIRGFGAFAAKDMGARQGRNPRTGESVAVTEKKAIHFKTGREMRKRLNPQEPENPEQIVARMLKAS